MPLLTKHRVMRNARRSLRCFRARTTSRIPRVRSRYIAVLLEVMSESCSPETACRARSAKYEDSVRSAEKNYAGVRDPYRFTDSESQVAVVVLSTGVMI